MDVLEHLEEEHRKVEKMIASLEATSNAKEREPILADLGDALATHMAVEEERVYRIVDERLGADKAREAQEEHDAARDDMAKMIEKVDSAGFADALAKFKEGIDHHVEEEEGELFPQLRQKAGDEIAALGDAHDVEDEVEEELGADV
ncbi:MAG TPA: hemerythrin domain-containing protein [Acidimicrobiales bacterium]|nr:hemerythrin domain-containing protein [Acidimicrobiales bacterium]